MFRSKGLEKVILLASKQSLRLVVFIIIKDLLILKILEDFVLHDWHTFMKTLFNRLENFIAALLLPLFQAGWEVSTWLMFLKLFRWLCKLKSKVDQIIKSNISFVDQKKVIVPYLHPDL